MNPDRRFGLVAGVALVAATLAVYFNCLGAPFLFDDQPAIMDNPTIRHLADFGKVLNPPDIGSGVTGRPAVNLSLAINYALGGLNVRGYHLMNVLLHALAALALWGVLRRTLRLWVEGAAAAGPIAGGPVSRPTAVGRDQPPPRLWPTGTNPPINSRPSGSWALQQSNGELFAFACALLWAVHPLLTESVVCVVQRTELLGGLFYLLTLYCFIRAATAASPGRGWQILAVVACLCGVASKEIVATAPLLVLLYDRTFLAGTFREAWRRRKGLHLALAATWLPLAWLMAHNLKRGGTVGFGLGMSPWHYLLTQCEALVIYLKLSLWPHPLIVDYGLVLRQTVGQVWWQGLVILALLAGTGIALRRKPVLGFLGAWFFVILAPSSSFIPLTTQPIAEHRMYLSLAAVLVLLAGAVARWAGRTGLYALLGLAAVAAGLTVLRNADYRSEMALWQQTVSHRVSARAVSSLGTAYYHQDNPAEAVRLYHASLEINPRDAHTHYNLGLVLDQQHHEEEAVASYAEALRLLPTFAQADAELGGVLVELGRLDEAEPHLRKAIAARPDGAEAQHSLGLLLVKQGRLPEALGAFEKALQLKPDMPDAHFNYAMQLAVLGRPEDALTHYREAIRLKPAHAEARMNLGVLLGRGGDLEAALVELREAVRLRPDLAEAHTNLGIALAVAGRPAEALASYEAALRLRPNYALAHYNFGNALLQLQRWGEARRHFAEALRQNPDLTPAREMLERLRDAPDTP